MRPWLARGCLLTILFMVAWPAPSLAISAIPPELSEALDGETQAAMVGDVDADGIRELVRILPWATNPGQLAVEVVSVDEDGLGVTVGPQAPLRRGIVPEDTFDGGPPPDGDNMLPIVAGQPVRLLAWRVAGVEHVIAAVIGINQWPRSCCLTLWEVGRDPNGAAELRLLADTQVGASSIRAVDLDGDATDELVTTAPPDAIPPEEVPVHVFRWQDGEFVRRSGYLTAIADGSALVPLGNSDGRPGEELGVVAGPQAAPPLLHRVSLDEDGALRTERGELPFPGLLAAFPSADGGRIVVASPEDGVQLLRWPGDGEIVVEASSLRRGVPMAVIGAGTSARLLLREGNVLHVLDPALRLDRSINRSPAAALFRDSPMAPYTGALPGGLPTGAAAFVFRGQLVTPAADGGRLDPVDARPMAALPGISPIGAFGPDGAWTALANATEFGAARDGGPLVLEAPAPSAPLTVVRTNDVLRPERDDGLLSPTVVGAIRSGRLSRPPLLLASGPFEVEVAGPTGTWVALDGDPTDDDHQIIGREGVVRVAVSGSEAAAGVDEQFSAQLQAVTPAGHGYLAEWDVQILRVPPPVRVSTAWAPLSFSVPLSGRTEPGTTVRVDGALVEVRANGSFNAEISAGPFPRDVRIEVSDAVGNTTTRTVSVVGFVDFRRLPGIPILVGVTLLVGAFLYLRVPRPARPAPRVTGDDATLEEID